MTKKITIDDLALMIKRGFDLTITKEESKNFATKDDLKNFVTKDDLKNFVTKDDLKEVWEELHAIHGDVSYIRNTMSGLIHSDIRHEDAIEDLTVRVHRLEKKTGIAK